MVAKVKELDVNWNGNYYHVIYGKHANGGWFAIPNWNAGGELSSFWDDVFWNTESICRSLKSKRAARVIALAIMENEKENI